MKSLYLARCESLSKYDSNDSKNWAEIFKIIGLNVSMIDRTNTIKMPFNFKIYDGFEMPNCDPSFNQTYEQCCDARAIELITLSRQLNKPITVLYSGGIDSTLVLISLIKNCPKNEIKDRVIVSLSLDSINENPNFYHNYIRKNFNIISSDAIGSLLDGSSIILGGEHNDQLFGSDLIGKIYREFDYDQVGKPYSRDFITRWFILKGMSIESANIWFDLLDNQIKTVAQCEITSNFHFFWWLNFCFKWQSVFFRILARLDINKRTVITKDFVTTYFHHFYSTKEFQLWSMVNNDKKLIDNWNTYKYEAKQVIYNFNHDHDYRDNKIKMGSLYRLFVQKNTAEAIDSNFNFIEQGKLYPQDYYNSVNSFT
jgi:hypothetical protein